MSGMPLASAPAAIGLNGLRPVHFADEITFHTPGLRSHRTSEVTGSMNEFVSISVTGAACALNCDHCQTKVLTSMVSLPQAEGGLFELCQRLKARGARGVLVSGGSDLAGRVPLKAHIPDLIRIRRELGLVVRVHTGLADDATCAALAEVGVDGIMVDVIGDRETIRDVYHLDHTPDDYKALLARLEHWGLPAIPHIILGHYYGRMLGEWAALEMVRRHPPKTLVLVILMPLSGTPMAGVEPPSLKEIGQFFAQARRTLPTVPIQLGCAKPLGSIKNDIDRLAIDAGFNGIAYPSEGIVGYAREQGLKAQFINACCGVTWA